MKFLDLLFELDEKRAELLRNNDLEGFKKTYSKKVRRKNINTPDFWTNHLLTESNSRDYMMEDRLEIVSREVLRSTGNVLNIGVGRGLLEEIVLTSNNSIGLFGVDITLPGLKKARQKSNFYPVCSSIMELPFSSKKFNTVTILEVLEHLYYDQILQALSESRRVLSECGILVVSVPINEKYSSGFNPNGHMRRYTKSIITKELEISGFDIINVYELYAFSSYYKLKKLIVSLGLTNRWSPNDLIIVARKR